MGTPIFQGAKTTLQLYILILIFTIQSAGSSHRLSLRKILCSNSPSFSLFNFVGEFPHFKALSP